MHDLSHRVGACRKVPKIGGAGAPIPCDRDLALLKHVPPHTRNHSEFDQSRSNSVGVLRKILGTLQGPRPLEHSWPEHYQYDYRVVMA